MSNHVRMFDIYAANTKLLSYATNFILFIMQFAQEEIYQRTTTFPHRKRSIAPHYQVRAEFFIATNSGQRARHLFIISSAYTGHI
jgi:hypothetical protein